MIEPVFADTKFNRRCDRSNAAADPRPVGMAPDRRHAQLAQALAAHHGPDARLKPASTAGRPALPRKRTPSRQRPRAPPATFRNSLRAKMA
jgi:hypothetical protein